MSLPVSRNFNDYGPTSTSLIVRIKLKDEEAWERLIKLYSRLVLYWCGKADIPLQNRKDILQDVFRTAFASIDKFSRHEPGSSFRAWLYTVTRTRIADYYRRNKLPAASNLSDYLRSLHAPLSPEDRENEIDDEEDQREEFIVLRQAVRMVRQKSEPKSWQAFWEMTIEGKTSLETASLLGMKPNAVRQTKRRILLMLKSEFEGLVRLDREKRNGEVS